jgi:hypothetical protein
MALWHPHLTHAPGEIYAGILSIDFGDEMDHEKLVRLAINQISIWSMPPLFTNWLPFDNLTSLNLFLYNVPYFVGLGEKLNEAKYLMFLNICYPVKYILAAQ